MKNVKAYSLNIFEGFRSFFIILNKKKRKWFEKVNRVVSIIE